MDTFYLPHFSEELEFTSEERRQTIESLELEMGSPEEFRRKEYKARIEASTGREIKWMRVGCSMCDGHGFSTWEPTCENCGGEGLVNAWIFPDCGHLVESNDCDEEECVENPCQVLVDLDVRCGHPITGRVSEPWTPRAFQVEVCNHHAKSFIEQGYKRVQETI